MGLCRFYSNHNMSTWCDQTIEIVVFAKVTSTQCEFCESCCGVIPSQCGGLQMQIFVFALCAVCCENTALRCYVYAKFWKNKEHSEITVWLYDWIWPQCDSQRPQSINLTLTKTMILIVQSQHGNTLYLL